MTDNQSNKSRRNILKFTKKPNFRSFKVLVSVMVLIGLGLFGFSSYYWYQNIFLKPDNVFWGMIDNSLQASSLTKKVEQTDGTSSQTERYYLQFTPQPLVKTVTDVEQIDKTRNKSSVTSESIGVKDADYLRYTAININKTDDDKTDYSKLLNTWAIRKTDEQKGQKAEALDQVLFTFIPFGNFSADRSTELMNSLKSKNVYSLKTTKLTYENMHPVYNVQLSLKPKSYIEVLNMYAKYSGLGDKETLQASNYDDSKEITVNIKIDALSRQLKEIEYDNGRVEEYVDYNVFENVELPKNTITIDELQARISPKS